MTTNEKQELNNLEIFVSNNIGKFSSMTFPTVITDNLGSGAWTIIQNFIRDGVIADLYSQEYEFTPIGHARYKILKRLKRIEYLKEWAFWMIFGFGLIAAGDVIWKHIAPESKSKTPTIQEQPPSQIKAGSKVPVLYNTISPPKSEPSESKKN